MPPIMALAIHTPLQIIVGMFPGAEDLSIYPSPSDTMSDHLLGLSQLAAITNLLHYHDKLVRANRSPDTKEIITSHILATLLPVLLTRVPANIDQLTRSLDAGDYLGAITPIVELGITIVAVISQSKALLGNIFPPKKLLPSESKATNKKTHKYTPKGGKAGPATGTSTTMPITDVIEKKGTSSTSPHYECSPVKTRPLSYYVDEGEEQIIKDLIARDRDPQKVDAFYTEVLINRRDTHQSTGK